MLIVCYNCRKGVCCFMTKKVLILMMILVGPLFLGGCGNVDSKRNAGQSIDDNTETEEDNELPVLILNLKKGETKTLESTYEHEKIKVEATLNNVSFESKVEPPTPQQSYYTYYDAAEGKSMVKIDLTVKNIGGDNFNSDYYFTGFLSDTCSPIMKFDNTYNYNGLTVVAAVKDSSGEYDLDAYHNLVPLDTVNYYLINEVPDSVKTMKAKITVCLGDRPLVLEF